VPVIAGRVRRFGALRLAAYAATWIIWGSTYLAIRVAVAVLPPLLLVAIRSTVAGAILVGWALARGEERPRPRQVAAAALTGAMFFLVGHGGLFWAERRVASGPAALMIATEHFWMLLAGSLLGIVAATWRAWAGVAIGLGGVALLVGGGAGGIDPLGAAVLLVAAAAWGLGTLFFTGTRKPRSQLYASGLPLVCGGVLVAIASAIAGEPWRAGLAKATPEAVGALAYLIVFGSVVAFTAYGWLVERDGPSRALSFTYVNPLVAVLLGAAFLREPLTWRIALAAAAIVASVVLVITGTREAPRQAAAPAAGPPVSHLPSTERVPSTRRRRRRRKERRP
jgi:drug/metabolite transporter (DMT)-like permease